MHGSQPLLGCVLLSSISILLTSCATSPTPSSNVRLPIGAVDYSTYDAENYAARLPATISTTEKVIMVDPHAYAWGAYNAHGELIRAGIATSGGDICEDEPGSCRTTVGRYRIYSLGGEECASTKYPRPNGGGLMPYCMFFNGGQSLHGSPDHIVFENNVSHGCIRMRIPDAEWMRYHFATVGTRVIIKPY